MEIFAAIAGVGAWINLFNLLPLGSLDGGRGFQAMSRAEKLGATLCVGAAWYFAQDGILVLLLIVCIGHLLAPRAKETAYPKAAILYCLLVLILTAISMVRTEALGQ
jgi:Zn-dependent protease